MPAQVLLVSAHLPCRFTGTQVTTWRQSSCWGLEAVELLTLQDFGALTYVYADGIANCGFKSLLRITLVSLQSEGMCGLPMYWHAASMVSLRWPTTVQPAFSAKAFSFSRCSKLMRVLVLFIFWLGRSNGFLGALVQFVLESKLQLFRGWPLRSQNGRPAWEGDISSDCVARFSTVMTGLASEEDGPSCGQSDLLSFRNMNGFCRRVRHSVVEFITCTSLKVSALVDTDTRASLLKQ